MFIEPIRSESFVTPECKQNAIPFICQYVYPPCHNDTSYQLITGEQCNYVKDEVCSTEWPIADAVLPGILPNCPNGSNETFCIDQFDTYCNELCVPSCKHFSQYDEAITSYRKAVDIIAAIVGLIGGTVFIIIAVRRRKNL